MGNKLSRLVHYLLRVDVFNRILVFLSMALFLVLPSYILYFVKDDNNTIATVLPSLLFLSVLLGSGAFALYRPVHLSFLYFAEILLLLLFFFDECTRLPPSIPSGTIHPIGIFWAEFAYTLIGLLLNAILYVRYLLRKKTDSLAEGTNNDTFFEFVSASRRNAAIEENLAPKESGVRGRLYRHLRKDAFSRVIRLMSAVVFLFCSVFSLLSMGKSGVRWDSFFFRTTLLGIFVLFLLAIFSFFRPKIFKYVYFYNTIIFSMAQILESSSEKIPPVFSIVSLTAVFLSLLLTLVVDGRTWMGATPDR